MSSSLKKLLCLHLILTSVNVLFVCQNHDDRVLGISSEDISRVMRRLTEIATCPDLLVGIGTDWKTLIHVIVNRFALQIDSN
jgi:hypothetical protein